MAGIPTGWDVGTFTVYGSNNNSTWVEIQTFSNPTQDHQADGELGFTLEFSSSQSYRYFKVVDTSGDLILVTVSGDTAPVNLGEIQYLLASLADPLTEVDSLSSTVDASVSVGTSFTSIHAFDSHPLYGFDIDDTRFVESDSLSSTIHTAYMAYSDSFIEEHRLSSTARIRINSVVAFTNSVLVGSSCLFVNALDTTFDLVSWNSLDEIVDSVVAFKNVLSDATVTSCIAFVNRVVQTDKVTSCIAFVNSIGEDDLKARSSFWGQGPVVHREGSHGGYE